MEIRPNIGSSDFQLCLGQHCFDLEESNKWKRNLVTYITILFFPENETYHTANLDAAVKCCRDTGRIYCGGGVFVTVRLQ